ncbi:ion transporter [Nodosilinea sp. PGN35]|uniref:ion transporter n=1 Tax=Nodosilinea sp. PGN35 TaxID=3020489 RepID=UPI0023B29932|nr:ion transporter [Nodosilinea sp. TSF1-S3]MDF0368570.1 NAD-binding protein [Nodosilinea sp. TSF1-S3]
MPATPFPAPSVKTRLNKFLHAPPTEFTLIGLILLSVLLVFVEVGSSPRSSGYAPLLHLQAGLTAIFWLELGARCWAASNRRRFLRLYWVDLLAVLPFPAGIPVLRLLRLLRLFRASMLLNHNLGRFAPALALGLGAQIGLLATIGVILLTGAMGLYLVESGQNENLDSLDKTLWWSLFMLVGAEPIGGEPTSPWGRALTLMLMLGGLTLFAVVTGLVSATMVQRLRSAMDFRPMDLDELSSHTVICGWNRNGVHVIEELLLDPDMENHPIVVVAEFTETPEQALEHLNLSNLYFHTADYTRIDVLQGINIVRAARAILLADTSRPRSDQDIDARTVLAALTIEKLNPAVYTCAQLLDRQNDVQLKVAGVDDVIVSSEITSHMIATSARAQGSVEVLAELLTVQVGNQIYKVPVPSSWVDLPFWQAVDHMKQRQDALPIAVEVSQPQRRTLVNPPASYRLAPGDQLVVIARRMPGIVD